MTGGGEISERSPAIDVTREYVATLQADLSAATAEIEGLRTAMQSRAVIEQAKGMIMRQLGVAADEAFQVLVRQSQKTHTKLATVAAEIVATVTSASAARDQ